MARASDLEKMSFADLNKMEARIARLKVEKQDAERKALRDKVLAMVKAQGFEMNDLFGRGGRRGKGTVAIKYRDSSNPQNTWTGRGRMPRWMTAATKSGRAKKEDFLI